MSNKLLWSSPKTQYPYINMSIIYSIPYIPPCSQVFHTFRTCINSPLYISVYYCVCVCF